MTLYGWDASNHDWPRGPMDLARAKREGIELFTHKSSEGQTFVDPNFDDAMARARPVGFSVLGAYHVLWPNNPTTQAAFWLATVNRIAPWWRDHPCFVWQIDAELFQNFVPYRAPTVAEINACGDWIVANAHVAPEQVPVYAPRWLYGDQLKGLRYPNLWSSAYVNGSGSPAQLYPGDGGQIWEPYSGMTPKVGQFTSSATIAGQSPADANAVRVASPAALQALFLGTTNGDDMSAEDVKAINDHTDTMLGLLWQAIGGQDNSVFAGGVTAKDTEANTLQLLQYLWSALAGQDNSVFSGGTNLGDLETKLAEQRVQLVADLTTELQNAGITIAQPVVEAALKNVLAKLAAA